ncbi:MAG: MFS transporter [Thermoplasmata archaeon]
MRRVNAVWTVGIIAALELLVMYVETMIIPALPTFISYFSTSYDSLSWIMTAYIIAGTVSSALFGKLADMYGKKKIFLMIAIVYAFSVSAGGFAKTLEELILIRTVQGIGMAMFPVGLALINDEIPKERVALAQAIVTSMLAAGSALGLVIGAWIIENFGWQWSFHSAIPVAFLLVFLAAIKLRESPSRERESIDYVGITTLASALIALILGISEGQTWGWASVPIITLFAVSFILVIFFVFFERNFPNPFIDMKLLRIRNVFLANFVGLFTMAGMFFLFFSTPSLMQDPEPAGFGVSIIESGLVVLPAAIINMVLAPVSAKLTNKKGPKFSILIGLSILLLSYLGLYFNRSTIIGIIEDATVLGLGLSFAFIGVINMLLMSVPKEKAGESTGMNAVFWNIGTSVASSISGVLETMYVIDAAVGMIPYRFLNLGFMPIYMSFPSPEAFDSIYLVGMAFVVVAISMSLFMEKTVIKGERNEI